MTGRKPPVLISPVLRIQAEPEIALPQDATLLLFTSVNGVAAWAERSKQRHVPALCVGENTAQAAEAHGFVAQSADGTGHDLLALVLEQATPADRIYYISGQDAALDLAVALHAQGFQAKRLILYAQQQIDLTETARDLLTQGRTIVPVFSPRTAAFFSAQIADLPLFDCTILCISANAAAPFDGQSRQVIVANHPTRAAMINSLDHLLGE